MTTLADCVIQTATEYASGSDRLASASRDFASAVGGRFKFIG